MGGLLIIDLLLGIFSLLVFNREFPYIIVRIFFVGLPYFAIGKGLRRNANREIDCRIMSVMVGIFSITTLLE